MIHELKPQDVARSLLHLSLPDFVERTGDARAVVVRALCRRVSEARGDADRRRHREVRVFAVGTIKYRTDEWTRTLVIEDAMSTISLVNDKAKTMHLAERGWPRPEIWIFVSSRVEAELREHHAELEGQVRWVTNPDEPLS
jgi:hypothetical protein